jgi:radical SAM superfamily enzyme YgiQ (UPF0313 family)
MTTLSVPTLNDSVTHPVHPRGSRACVLLSSVFGPYAQDDAYGSRSLNPMELYQNQVTRTQGVFSLRMFHRSWGLMLIQANITAPCTLLDFPSEERFIREITTQHYDIVGISAIIPNVGKVRRMCQLIREHLPEATIVIGGHVANMPDLDQRIDADHIVRGEGIRWMRGFLGEDVDRPISHPDILSAFGTRSMGVRLREKPGDVAATLIPSVGCPLGCNFCSTSAMFGGKGRSINFYETGDELFEVMCRLERNLKVRSFFVMDENFLLHRKRALRLLELMEQHDKSWALYVFSSANVLRSYKIEQLVALGISWVWIGLEGDNSQYTKLKGTDPRELVRTLQANGIRVLGSTIIGLEEHTPENIDTAIDYAVSYDTEFHQFMLYTPIPGTALHAQHKAAGTLLDPADFDEADIHGQYKFNYRHPHIPAGLETELIVRAFERDFEVNGPSVIRVIRTTLAGFRRYRNHPDARIRARFRHEGRELPTAHAGALWAARRWYRDNPAIYERISKVLADLHREFGWRSRLAAPLIGRYIFASMKREQRRLQSGWTYEPATFEERVRQETRRSAAAAPVSATLGALEPAPAVP